MFFFCKLSKFSLVLRALRNLSKLLDFPIEKIEFALLLSNFSDFCAASFQPKNLDWLRESFKFLGLIFCESKSSTEIL